MIYSSNRFNYNYKYLDEKTFIVNIMKKYCNTYYTDNYRHLYNQRFYDFNINKYILIMILTNKILKSDFKIINYIKVECLRRIRNSARTLSVSYV